MASLRQKLAGGLRLTICDAETVAVEVLQKPALVEEALACLLDNDQTVGGRAAYVMMRIGQERPEWLRPYKSLLLGEVAAIQWWNVRYQLCKVIPQLGLSGAEIRLAVELYQSFLADKSGAVRSFSLSGLAELAGLDPELRAAVIAIIEEHMPTGTPAMRARTQSVGAVVSRRAQR